MSPFKALELKNLSLINRFVRSATHDYAQECNGLMSDNS